MQQQDLLVIEDLEKSFTMHVSRREIHVCRGISLRFVKGEFIEITGKSGSGRSTILKGICRTNLPQKGKILHDNERFGMLDLCQVSERRMIYLRKQEIGYVSQFLRVMPRATARQITKQAVSGMEADKDTARRRTQHVPEHSELEPALWDTYPNTFSGGEKLRLSIVAAMIKKPCLLLLDEPTASLDHTNKQEVRDLIEQLKLEGTTMFGIFHNLEFIKGLCDREYNIQGEMMAWTVSIFTYTAFAVTLH